MRLACVQVGHVHRLISIHAPQWGATERPAVTRHEQVISIHAPQWGATGCRSCVRVGCCNFNPRTPVGCDSPRPASPSTAWNFNPRTPVGCDTRIRLLTLLVVLISIHAPQWGATVAAVLAWFGGDISIHAPQWGATISRLCETRNASGFQSTHPSGVRPDATTPTASPTTFQSTHPSGVRHVSVPYSRLGFYFNPRTPVGCDTAFMVLRQWT